MQWVKAGFIKQSQSTAKTNTICELKAHAGTRRNVDVGRCAYSILQYTRDTWSKIPDCIMLSCAMYVIKYILQYLAMFTPKLTASAAFTASARSISLASACSENAPAQWWIPFVLCKSGNHPMYRWCNRWWLICWGVHRLSLCGFQRFFQCLLFCLASWGSVLWQENIVDIRVSPEKGDSGHLHLWSGIPLWPFQSMSYDYIPQLIWSGILDTSKMDGHAIYDDYWIRQFHILRQSPAAEHWTSLNSRGESHFLDGTCWSWEAF